MTDGAEAKEANMMVARPYNRAIFKDLACDGYGMNMELMRDAVRYVQAELSVMLEDEQKLRQVRLEGKHSE